MWIPLVLNALFLSALLTLSHGLLKWVATHSTDSFIQAMFEYWWVIGFAISAYVIIFFYYAYVLRTIDIAALYPVYTGLSIIFVFLMGVFVFDETASIQQLFGCVLIISGVALVSRVAN